MSGRRRRHFFGLIALMLVGAAAELITIGAALPFLALLANPAGAESIVPVRAVFEVLGWRSGEDLILPATLLLISAAVAAAAVRLILAWTTQAFVFRFGHEIGVAIYRRMLRQPYLSHLERNSSEAITAVEKVQQAVFSVLLPVMQGVVAAFMALFIIALLIAIDPYTAILSATTLAFLYIGLSFATRRRLEENSRIIGEAQTARVKQVQEGLGGIRDILLDRSQAVFEAGFRRADERLRRAQVLNSFVSTSPRLVIESAGIILIAVLALLMSREPGGLLAAIPILGALAIGAQRLLPLLQMVYMAISRATGSLHVLHEIANLAQPIPLDDVGIGSLPPLSRQIALDGVSFRYPGGRKPALTDLSLRIRKGERIGLIGETGSGKSTLLDLLMGLLEPAEGTISIDGVGLGAETQAEWQAQVAHVPQFIYLADSSIEANIAFGADPEEIDLERVRQAAARAQVASFIESLPQGYETMVGERGVRLSGGQRQRIGIARALYKRAGVLILDEATSALDDDTERAVIEALAAGDEGLTIIMVAHRLTTLSACDRVVRLSDGCVVEEGGYDEVIGRANVRCPA
jgi:ATP-binding cassette subfamily B protein